MPRILGILGAGRAAWAFGATWRRMGWPLAGVTTRRETPLPDLLHAERLSIDQLAERSDLLLLAVSDRAIAEVAAALPESHAVIFHASGSLTSVRNGFSLHPLRALPPIGEPSDLRDTLLVFEGAHRETAREIADAAGARFAEIAAEQKTLYHAAAVFGSNYVAALLEIAERLIGLPDVRDDLASLAISAIENWRTHRDGARFTGPAARGDQSVLEGHQTALANHAELGDLYGLLADEIARSLLATGK